MELHTERLLLREISIADAPYLLAQLNDPGWLKNIGDRNVHTIEEAETYIAKKVLPNVEKGIGTFFVLIRHNDPHKKIIGQCGVFKREGLQQKDLGYALLEEYCGHGYGYEAAKAVLSLTKKDLGSGLIAAITGLDNIPSQKLLEKLGMKYIKDVILPNIEGSSMYYELDLTV